MNLASFDIFDTTILRRCGRPETIWELLANRLYPADIDLREAFILWRKQVVGKTLDEIIHQVWMEFITKMI